MHPAGAGRKQTEAGRRTPLLTAPQYAMLLIAMSFDGFANVWTPVLLKRRLAQRPLRVVVAGEPIVLFRDGRGAVGALLDRCPHRGVALSLGQVLDDGTLECPFHGWRFDVSGANRRAPLNPEARCENLSATALPVREIGEMIWVYTGPGVRSAPEPVVPEGLADPALTRTYIERHWACHWTRAMENMLDSPHLPFIHRRTIGRFYRRKMTPDSRMDIRWEDTDFGGRAWASLDGEESGGWLEFYRPNIMVLHLPIPKRHLRLYAMVVPAEVGATRLTVAMSRDFLRLGLFEPMFRRTNGRIADEDRAVVESSGPEEVPRAGEERSVGSDRATLQFRRYYDAELRGRSAGRLKTAS
jgi:phenylpropionate dioxygenase-like ring-hydroxylating dioxygenase large terminal subunit